MRESAASRTGALLDQIRAFVREELYPLVQDLPQRDFRATLLAPREKRPLACEWGVWAPHLPPELGGPELSLPEFAHVSEAPGSTVIGQSPETRNTELLLLLAIPAQRERILQPLESGAVRSCFAMTEPEHASPASGQGAFTTGCAGAATASAPST